MPKIFSNGTKEAHRKIDNFLVGLINSQKNTISLLIFVEHTFLVGLCGIPVCQTIYLTVPKRLTGILVFVEHAGKLQLILMRLQPASSGGWEIGSSLAFFTPPSSSHPHTRAVPLL